MRAATAYPSTVSFIAEGIGVALRSDLRLAHDG